MDSLCYPSSVATFRPSLHMLPLETSSSPGALLLSWVRRPPVQRALARPRPRSPGGLLDADRTETFRTLHRLHAIKDKVHIVPTHDHDAAKHLHTTTQSDDLGPGDDVDACGARRRDQRRLRWQRHHVEHRARWRSLVRRRPARSPPVAVDPTTPRRYGVAPGQAIATD